MKEKSLLASFLILKGMTYTQFAEEVGVSARTVSYWSDGIFYPSAKHIKKIERVVGVKILKIFPTLLTRK